MWNKGCSKISPRPLFTIRCATRAILIASAIGTASRAFRRATVLVAFATRRLFGGFLFGGFFLHWKIRNPGIEYVLRRCWGTISLDTIILSESIMYYSPATPG